ncbi:dermonecrotic toxin domain-containing protein, partial [Pseudomonas viridiflava]|uniref:dermonecrotic toxin domain-containing protein n=1 Tax=Pseudomonas viridiflava TaxID=33069 RepID=UPI003216D1E5
KLIANVLWTRDYCILLETFWARHRQSYRTPSRLGFLDTLVRQYARGQISRYGSFLTLDALGLKDFPTDLSLLEQSGRGKTAEVRMLTFNGDPVAGLFQVSSTATSHCFIHVLDNRGTVIE